MIGICLPKHFVSIDPMFSFLCFSIRSYIFMRDQGEWQALAIADHSVIHFAHNFVISFHYSNTYMQVISVTFGRRVSNRKLGCSLRQISGHIARAKDLPVMPSTIDQKHIRSVLTGSTKREELQQKLWLWVWVDSQSSRPCRYKTHDGQTHHQ